MDLTISTLGLCAGRETTGKTPLIPLHQGCICCQHDSSPGSGRSCLHCPPPASTLQELSAVYLTVDSWRLFPTLSYNPVLRPGWSEAVRKPAGHSPPLADLGPCGAHSRFFQVCPDFDFSPCPPRNSPARTCSLHISRDLSGAGPPGSSVCVCPQEERVVREWGSPGSFLSNHQPPTARARSPPSLMSYICYN